MRAQSGPSVCFTYDACPPIRALWSAVFFRQALVNFWNTLTESALVLLTFFTEDAFEAGFAVAEESPGAIDTPLGILARIGLCRTLVNIYNSR